MRREFPTGRWEFPCQGFQKRRDREESCINPLCPRLLFQKHSAVHMRLSPSLQYCCVTFRNHLTSLSSGKTELLRPNRQSLCKKWDNWRQICKTTYAYKSIGGLRPHVPGWVGAETTRRRPDCSDVPASDPERMWRRGWVNITSSLVSCWERVVVDPAGARPSPSSPKVRVFWKQEAKLIHPPRLLPSSPKPVLHIEPHSPWIRTAPWFTWKPPPGVCTHNWIFTANQEMARRWEVTCPRYSEHSKKWYQDSTTGLPEPKAGLFHYTK